MDVTVNIRGNAQGLKEELDNVSSTVNQNQGQTSPGREIDNSRQPTLPPSDRLVDDIRRTILQQGAVMVPGSYNYRQLLQSHEQNYRVQMNNDITNKYDSRRADVQARMEAEYEKIDKDIEQKRQEGLRNLGPSANDPLYRSVLEKQLADEETRRYKKVGTMFDAEFDEIDKQEAQEKTEAERELTEAIKRLTGEFQREDKETTNGSNPNSYINQLREQRRKLLMERDNAPDEASALEAQGRINAVDDQLSRIMKGGIEQRPYYDSVLQGTQGLSNMFGGLAGGDLAGALTGAGAAYAGLSGMGLKAALRFMGWVGLVAGGVKGIQGIGHGYDDLGNLAAYRSSAGGYRGEKAMGFLAENIGESRAFGMTPGDFDMKMEEFILQASKRIRARGSSDDWYKETMAGIGLERSLALEQDALVRGAKYDRYGTNVTDAVSQLVTMLAGIKDSGVSWGDFSRVQEKYDIQQQLMASYMNRADTPKYQWANNTLAAFSATGVQQDSRMGEDIAAFQGMIQNPLNERMRALIYGTVSDIMPETGGRMDLIDRAIRDPANEGKIMQAVVQRIQEQFGGTDTTMGYFAFKTLLPNIAPDRLDEYIEQISSGAAGSLLRRGGASNQRQLDEVALEKKAQLSQEASELISAMSKFGTNMMNFLRNEGVKVSFGNGVTPNTTKRGN